MYSPITHDFACGAYRNVQGVAIVTVVELEISGDPRLCALWCLAVELREEPGFAQYVREFSIVLGGGLSYRDRQRSAPNSLVPSSAISASYRGLCLSLGTVLIPFSTIMV